MPDQPTRRQFTAATAAALSAPLLATAATEKPALLGGEPVRRTPFPAWPIFDGREEKELTTVLRSGKWGRGVGTRVAQFEDSYKNLMGARHCLATANGTSALIASLAALGVEAGDEVIVPPYTFVATINAVLMFHALPVFVDTDPETFQIDARKVEAALSDRTVALLPVHLGGNVADLDALQSIAGKHRLPLLEDACQAHLAEWRGRKVGTFGAAGCYSFQASKNLNSGEGGAVLTNDDALADRLYTIHNNGRSRTTAGYTFSYQRRGANLRLTEFQGALLEAQMTRLNDQASTRDQNARYLTSLLGEVPGIRPARAYAGCTRNAYHLYMFRYDPAAFAGLPRARFLEAMNAEGIPASGGYSPLNREPFLRNALVGRGFQRLFSKEHLARWEERNQCPANDRLCNEAVWLTQTMLLGPRADMDAIAGAVRKVQRHAAALNTGASAA